MNRTLRRPMFRKGGSTGEGITSGLAPRQGYATNENNTVKQDDLSKIDVRDMNMQQLKDLSQRMAYQAPPMQPDNSLRNFKIDFGLDLVSRSPGGNIFQTAGAAAKEPFSNFRTSKAAYNKGVSCVSSGFAFLRYSCLVERIIFRSFNKLPKFSLSIGVNHFESSKAFINIDVAPWVTAVLKVLPTSVGLY